MLQIVRRDGLPIPVAAVIKEGRLSHSGDSEADEPF
jgi:hypothetical protein